jgi:hypothetical protein
MGFFVKGEFANTRRKLAGQSRGFRASLPDELKRAGRLISVSLATSTQPYGIDDGARRKGEGATAGDIRRCYATPSNVFEAFPDQHKAASFWKAIKAGKIRLAEKIMQSHCPQFANKEIKPFDAGSGHRGVRNNRGRVSNTQEPLFVVQTTRDLLAYIKRETDHVGEGKAGWAACAKILGGARGLPQWVTRHAGKLSGGAVVENYGGNINTITLINQVRYATNILSTGEKQIALRIGIDRLLKGIVRAELAARRANR